MNKLLLILYIFCYTTGSFAANSKDVDTRLTTLFGEYKPYKTFFYKLQRNVQKLNVQTLSEMMSYPLRTSTHGKIQNKKEFILNFEKLFNAKVKAAILNQKYSQLFSNWRGFMYGNGVVWVNGICDPKSTKKCLNVKVKVVTLNNGA